MIKSLKGIKRKRGIQTTSRLTNISKPLKDIPAEVAAEFAERYRTDGRSQQEAVAALFDEVKKERAEKLSREQIDLVTLIFASGGIMIVNGDRCEIYKLIDGSPLDLGKIRRLIKRGALVSNDDGLFPGHTPQTMSLAAWAVERAGVAA
jgi:hypothetical protein